jgi:hypothetical protein
MIRHFDGPTPRIMSTQAFIDGYVLDSANLFIECDLVQLWIIGSMSADEMGFERVKVAVQALDGSESALAVVAMRRSVFEALVPVGFLYSVPGDAEDIESTEVHWVEPGSGYEVASEQPSVSIDEAYGFDFQWTSGLQPIEETIDFLQRAVTEILSEAYHSYVQVMRALHRRQISREVEVQIATLCRCVASILEVS